MRVAPALLGKEHWDREMDGQMEVKERPILFSGPMVRAILNDRKYQTRRVVQPQPDGALEILGGCDDLQFGGTRSGNLSVWRCPFGKPGDRLWVRETWAVVPRVTDNGPKHKAKGDGTGATWRADWNGNPSGFKWKPSIHMPRWASRITLEVTGVTVERLHDISPDDVAAEGVEFDMPELTVQFGVDAEARYCMSKLWESINGEGSWNLNPWVWVVSFERVTA